jgi:hypothetical protein
MSDLERIERGHEPATPEARRLWFRVEEVKISWLPIGEVAFLLWVLVVLLGAWLGVGVALGVV